MQTSVTQLIIPPLIEPLSLAEIKMHLRCDTEDTVEDEALIDIGIAAREHIEDITRRHLLTQTWDFKLHNWPYGNSIKLPGGNLQTVLYVKWKNTFGNETTLIESTDYLIEQNWGKCGRIITPTGKTWPSEALYPVNPITIRFVSGWGTAKSVPYKIKAACKMICADLYEMRGEPVLGQTVTINKTVQNLLASSRLWDEF